MSAKWQGYSCVNQNMVSAKCQLAERLLTKRCRTIKNHPSKMIHVIRYCSFLQLPFREVAIKKSWYCNPAFQNKMFFFLKSNVFCIVVSTFTESAECQLAEWFLTKRCRTIKNRPNKMIHVILYCSFLQLPFLEVAIKNANFVVLLNLKKCFLFKSYVSV